MSIVDENGQPVAYGWNEIAASERWEKDCRLRLISDEEFARRFPHIVAGKNPARENPAPAA
ncbi:MAG TPA: hypothetical protein VF773_16180 [Verrucomicrobiae bacterium]